MWDVRHLILLQENAYVLVCARVYYAPWMDAINSCFHWFQLSPLPTKIGSIRMVGGSVANVRNEETKACGG